MSLDDASVMNDDLYREIILDHYSNPRCKGHLEQPTHQMEGINPSCGDAIEMDLMIKDGRVVDVAFVGHGCSISMASASMLAENVRGRSLAEVEKLAAAFKARQLSKGDLPEPPEDVDIGELEALDGVRRYPVRIKCALLAWNTMLNALKESDEGS